MLVDVEMMLLTVLCFAVVVVFAYGCDRLMGSRS